MSDQKNRRIVGPARVRLLVRDAIRGGVCRVELTRPDTFAPLGDPAKVAADANSALVETRLPWAAVQEGSRVYLIRSSS